MTEYTVSFFKTIVGGRGVPFQACQWTGTVEAADEPAAILAAERLFCARDHLPRWSAHADRVQVAERTKTSAGPT